MKKHPFCQNINLINTVMNPTMDINRKLQSSEEFITFCCHPRFLRETALHSHSFIEMIYVYSGQCQQTINDIPTTMHQGDICLVDMNVKHLIDCAEENDIIINCLLNVNYLENIVLSRLAGNDLFSDFFIHSIYQSREYNNFMMFTSNGSDKISELMAELLCEGFDRSTICSDEVINCYMILLMTELLNNYNNNPDEETKHTLQSIKLSDILYYIHSNCNSTTLADTAEHFHFHPNYLSTMMKKVTGRNFTGILHEAKLSKALVLLTNSQLAVSEIAHMIGYQNINFFYQIFKKQYGMTPAEYRKQSLKLRTNKNSNV
ncbi:MAG: AraC-type DNA-binding protein [Firmicutes bacterium]|nr:AraC-type DNA-binding protein [Bacillota bacterium]